MLAFDRDCRRPSYTKSSCISRKTKHKSYAMFTYHLVFKTPNIAIGTWKYESVVSFILTAAVTGYHYNKARSMDSLIDRWCSNHGSEHIPRRANSLPEGSELGNSYGARNRVCSICNVCYSWNPTSQLMTLVSHKI